ncbi:LytR/AlgR family response regulator transcription factor [Halothermothrix orenii]|uniref:Stage 0 sporulation protein A homolog n=1 Tax=Halothermothrix orenii (strain H 168 / OCM 544 / DSM 9562) TaxID=373903 RepID=B8CWX9_HALOH|nr:LytTR family DNA-binding domain-containing protein [Halothermothrix orenii]ACL69798.1 two component transcriptional regulator, LytTR family [Halothermothrix orenii H 168]
MEMQALVVDDEAPARNELIFMLENSKVNFRVREADNGKKALELVNNHNFDVIFLDIQMPSLTGLEVAAEILKVEDKPEIVFVTAYDEYAIKAFELNAVDYLLKPFSRKRFEETINRVMSHSKKDRIKDTIKINKAISQLTPELKRIPVNSKRGRIKLLKPSEIYYATTEGGKVFITSEEGVFEFANGLKELEEMLNLPQFFRCHRSYLVNLSKVKELIPWFKGNYYLIINDESEEEIPVGRTRVNELKKKLNL